MPLICAPFHLMGTSWKQPCANIREHTRIHAYKPTYIQTYIQTDLNTHTHTYTGILANIHNSVHANPNMDMQTYMAVNFSIIFDKAYLAWPWLCKHIWDSLACMAVSFSNISGQPILHDVRFFQSSARCASQFRTAYCFIYWGST